LTPTILKINAEKIIKRSPVTAAVRSSFPAWILLGFPVDPIIKYPENIIRIVAIPPPIPNAQRRINAAKLSLSLIGIQPIAVFIDVPSGHSGLIEGKGVSVGTPGVPLGSVCGLQQKQ